MACKKLSFFIVFVSAFLSACSGSADQNPQKTLEICTYKIGEHSFELELADEPHERQKGLMFRKELAEKSGMIFLWDKPAYRAMWMKNTYIPLDMIFIRDERVVGMVANTTPFSLDSITVDSAVDAIVELKAGSIKKYDLIPDMKAELHCQN